MNEGCGSESRAHLSNHVNKVDDVIGCAVRARADRAYNWQRYGTDKKRRLWFEVEKFAVLCSVVAIKVSFLLGSYKLGWFDRLVARTDLDLGELVR